MAEPLAAGALPRSLHDGGLRVVGGRQVFFRRPSHQLDLIGRNPDMRSVDADGILGVCSCSRCYWRSRQPRRRGRLR